MALSHIDRCCSCILSEVRSRKPWRPVSGRSRSSPNNAEILAEFGMRLALMGQWERGISLIDEAIARNPAHPGWYHTAPALNFYRQGRYAEALEEARQIDAPGWVHNHTILAMIYGQLGQEEEARAAARRILRAGSGFRGERLVRASAPQLPGADGGAHGRGPAQSRLAASQRGHPGRSDPEQLVSVDGAKSVNSCHTLVAARN